MRRKLVAIILFVFALAYVGSSEIGSGMGQEMAYAAHRGVYRYDRDIDTGGATNVARDLYPYHWADSNQFGDDEAYNNASTGRSEVPYPIHREDR